MKCYNCGNKIDLNSKFCPECGRKITENKIDKTVDKMKSNFLSIKKEVSESETVETVTIKAKKSIEKLIKILGVLGIIVISLIIIHPIITGKDFYILWVAKKYFKNNVYYGKLLKTVYFISEIFIPVIVPMIFIYLGFKKNDTIKYILFALIAFLLLFIVLLQILEIA